MSIIFIRQQMEVSKQCENSPGDHSIEITIDQVDKQIKDSEGKIRLVDIREQRELLVGSIEGALHLPFSTLATKVEERLPDKKEPVVLYCASGNRSVRAASLMKAMGYRYVKSMAGGFKAWVEAGCEIVTEGAMEADQINRYSRQILLTGVGEEGQLKLLRSKVLIVGAGGLGVLSPFTLRPAESAPWESLISTRWVLATFTDRFSIRLPTWEGQKPNRPLRNCQRINPDVAITVYQEKFEAGNALKLVEAYDIVVDGIRQCRDKISP